ncbi:MAG: purine-nucleoside phosphorylase [Deltaproteobacteria bacterium]|nr:purine-nucleoside phosphorylase [Deltaproteobacteria bacterium]
MKDYFREVENIGNELKKNFDEIPEILLVLGSGLGFIADILKDKITVPYKSLRGFPTSTVSGHEGLLIKGSLNNRNVLLMKGRFHYYEGYSMQEIALPYRAIFYSGVKKMIVTNAAGGINKSFNKGDIMLITDHINLMGDSPLIGKNCDRLGPRFPDMTYAYSKRLQKIAEQCARRLKIKLRKGVYVAMHGPSYETPAEIRFLRIIGADAVGMSTVPEVIVANHMGVEVLGFSAITNMAAGIEKVRLSHSDINEVAEKIKDRFYALITEVLTKI